MQRYKIFLDNEYGIHSRSDSYFIQIKIVDALSNALTDPTTVKISINNPCGTALIASQDMTKSATGKYYYNYSIASDAPYGKYSVKVATTSETCVRYFNYVIFPWDTVSQIRTLLGSYRQNDITDYKIAIVAWDAYIDTLMSIYDFHFDEKPLCNPDDGSWFDGTNKKFKLRNYPIADFDGDGVVSGYGEATCTMDVQVRWIDNTGNSIAGKVVVSNSRNGIVELTKADGSAIPQDNEGVFVTYHTEAESYNQLLMREAVSYRTAHKLLQSFQSLDKATMADLQVNEQKLESDLYRMKKLYQSIIDQIGGCNIGSGK